MFQTWFRVKGLLSNQEFKKKVASVISHRIPRKDVSKAIETVQMEKAVKVILNQTKYRVGSHDSGYGTLMPRLPYGFY